jgi:FkbM family methyltransferase
MTAFLTNRAWYDRLGFKWLLDASQLIDGEILRSTPWEPASTNVVNTFVKPGMTVFDIGANMGYYTLLMSRLVGPAGKVISVEAMEEPAWLVREHVKANGLGNVIVLENAIDDREGDLETCINYSWRTDGIVNPLPPSKPVGHVTVDSIVETLELDRVDFLKIDLDGYDARCLRGAGKTLDKHHPVIIFEVCDYTLRATDNPTAAYGVEVRKMLENVISHGYGLFWEETLEGVPSLDAAIHTFDLSQRSINLVAKPSL